MVCCCMHHRAAIDKLRQQNARLKEDLLLENKFSVRPSNPGATVLINKLQDEADVYTRKVGSTAEQHTAAGCGICDRAFGAIMQMVIATSSCALARCCVTMTSMCI
eukprot:GHRQ01021107.1.p2 GENE.GHRQ01021107.1~~GHRQ01021107.1.p2  ORF type:complete len:106 (+),score=26.07 GHRQ01021107.1:473-790(+)